MTSAEVREQILDSLILDLVGPVNPIGSKGAVAPGAKGTALEAQLTVFGLGTDSALYYRTKRGGVWIGDGQSLGGVFIGPPAVISWGANRLDVFGVGTDAAMHHRSYASGWDAGWTSLWGQFTSPPAVVARGPNKLDVFGLGGECLDGFGGRIWSTSALCAFRSDADDPGAPMIAG